MEDRKDHRPRKLMKLSAAFQITLPRRFCRALKIKPTDLLEVILDVERELFVVVPRKVVPR